MTMSGDSKWAIEVEQKLREAVGVMRARIFDGVCDDGSRTLRIFHAAADRDEITAIMHGITPSVAGVTVDLCAIDVMSVTHKMAAGLLLSRPMVAVCVVAKATYGVVAPAPIAYGSAGGGGGGGAGGGPSPFASTSAGVAGVGGNGGGPLASVVNTRDADPAREHSKDALIASQARLLNDYRRKLGTSRVWDERRSLVMPLRLSLDMQYNGSLWLAVSVLEQRGDQVFSARVPSPVDGVRDGVDVIDKIISAMLLDAESTMVALPYLRTAEFNPMCDPFIIGSLRGIDGVMMPNWAAHVVSNYSTK